MARLKWSGSIAAEKQHEEAVKRFLRKKGRRSAKRKQQQRQGSNRKNRKNTEQFVVNRDNYQVYLASKHWKSTAARKRRTSRYRCQKCGHLGYLEVHHLHYRTLWKENDADLECLCRPCHESRHEHDRNAENHLRSIMGS